MQEYLDAFSYIFLVDFGNADVLECLALNAQEIGVRQRQELVYHGLDVMNQSRFKKAMLHEWQVSILRHDAAKLLPLSESLDVRQNESMRNRIVSTFWWKTILAPIVNQLPRIVLYFRGLRTQAWET